MPTSEGETLEAITRLDNEQLDVVVYDENDEVKDITNDTLIFEARLNAKDALPLFSKSSEYVEEIQKVTPSQGVAKVFIDPEDTALMTKKGNLYCTLKVIDIANRTSSVMVTLPVRYRV